MPFKNPVLGLRIEKRNFSDLDGVRDQESSMSSRSAGFIGTAMLASFVALGLALSVSLPSQSSDCPAFLLTFADFMSALVPSINSFASVSSFPFTTRLFLSIEWSTVPFLAMLIRLQPSLVEPNKRTLLKFSKFKVLLLVFAVTGLLVIYPATVQVRDDDLTGAMLHEWAFRSASTSKVWLGLIGSTVIFAVAYFAALSFSYFKALWK